MNKEIRTIQTQFEIRAAEEGKEGRAIGGIAAIVETPAVLWESEWNGRKEIYQEIIKRGAFDDVLGDDVRALFNHNSDKVLGRTTAGTLKIYLTSNGDLGYDVPDVPDTTFGNDLLVNVRRGEVNQSSFGFYVGEDIKTSVETDKEIVYTRTIVKFRQLDDVSPVTFPAYQQTLTELRDTVGEMFKEERSKRTEPPKIDPNDDLAIKQQQKHLKMRISINKNK